MYHKIHWVLDEAMHEGTLVQCLALCQSSVNAGDQGKHIYLSGAYRWLFQGSL